MGRDRSWRKRDAEGRPAAFPRVEVDVAVVPLYHHQHRRQPEPGALALGLGGHEGLEESGPYPLGDARTLVGDRDEG